MPRPDPQHALTLAALRIVMPLVIVASPELREGPAWAALPAAVRAAPEGLGWFVKYAPIDPTLAHVIQAACVCVFAALLSIAGVCTHVDAAVGG